MFVRDTRYMVPGWLRQQAGLGRIGSDARSPARTAYGLAIENVERAWHYGTRTGVTNYSSLSSTTWTDLDSTNLAWTVTTSGKRPLEFRITGWLGVGAGLLMGVSVAWDGVEVTGFPYGMAGVYQPASVMCVSGFGVLPAPSPGSHRMSVVYRVSGGASGLVQVDSSTHLFVSVKEI